MKACHDCDALQQEVALEPGGVARCWRCDAVLYRGRHHAMDRTLALTLAAAALFVLALSFPLVELDMQGQHHSTTLWGAVVTLWRQDAELVAMLVLILSAMNVVREKEIGTIEQINVTPIRKWQFILGKLLPFLFIGLFDLVLGLTVGKLLFNIPMEGDLWLVFAFCVVNIFCVLGIGFFISNFADTQQQAMFMAWFFMVIFILMSGLFTPIESMPAWAQALTVPNPIAHFVTVMRLVLLKGSGWLDIRYNFFVMIGLGILFNALAVWTYRKTAG